MKHPLFQYICCPNCTSDLLKRKKTYVCSSCNSSFRTHSDIPILVNLEELPKHLEDQISYFEEEKFTSPEYSLSPWQERYVNNFLTYAKPKKGGLIVDNATGSGYMAIELARRGYRVIATDLTLSMLVKLQKIIQNQKLEKNILLICCTSEQLPIRKNVAYGLISNAILEHLPKEKQAIQEIKRVVRKAGVVLVAVPLSLLYVNPLLWFVNIIHDKRIGHLRRYTRMSLVHKFSGFKELHTYYTGHMVKVFFLLLFFLTKKSEFEQIGERLDKKFEKFPVGANNVVTIVRKKA